MTTLTGFKQTEAASSVDWFHDSVLDTMGLLVMTTTNNFQIGDNFFHSSGDSGDGKLDNFARASLLLNGFEFSRVTRSNQSDGAPGGNDRTGVLPCCTELLEQLTLARNARSERPARTPEVSASESPTPSAQGIRELIYGTGNETQTHLGSAQFTSRMRAQERLIEMGVNALPQLMLAEHQGSESLETRRRAREAINGIVRRLSDDDLVLLRDPQHRGRIVERSLGRTPTNAENQRIESAIDEAVTTSVENRLISPEWLSLANYHGYASRVEPRGPSEEAIAQIERLSTPQGRSQVEQRVNQLAQFLGSNHITESERETISNQLAQLSLVSSPAQIRELAVGARVALSNRLELLDANSSRAGELRAAAQQMVDPPNPEARPEISQALRNQLIRPQWLTDMRYGKNNPPSDETIRQVDRMATEQGRRDVVQRLGQLARMLTSDDMTATGREIISSQILELSEATSPRQMAVDRIESRMALAQHLTRANDCANERRIHTLVLEAHRLATEKGTGGLLLKEILQMGLDQNPMFMQQFTPQASERQLESLQNMRQSLIQLRD